MLKKSLSVVLSVLMMLGAMSCAFAAEGDAPSSFGYYKHVFIIGVDGATTERGINYDAYQFVSPLGLSTLEYGLEIKMLGTEYVTEIK